MAYWSVRDYPGSDYHDRLHRRLMAACETFAAATDMVIDAVGDDYR